MSASYGWRVAALQLLGAAERFIRRDGEPHTATDQLCNFEQFRERVAMLRSEVERLEGDRVEFIPDWVRCDLVRNPRPGSITYVSDLEAYVSDLEEEPNDFGCVMHVEAAPDDFRFWLLTEDLLERERLARTEWMHTTGMV